MISTLQTPLCDPCGSSQHPHELVAHHARDLMIADDGQQRIVVNIDLGELDLFDTRGRQ